MQGHACRAGGLVDCLDAVPIPVPVPALATAQCVGWLDDLGLAISAQVRGKPRFPGATDSSVGLQR
jgi:hypothetical protein